MPAQELVGKLKIGKTETTEKYLQKINRITIRKDFGKIINKRRRKNEQKVEDTILKRTPWLLDKMFELADGLMIVDKHNPGRELRYYKMAPDRQAITYLLDRAIGKPRQAESEIDESKEGLLVIEQIIKSMALDGRNTKQELPEPQKRLEGAGKEGN
ncbi:MAG TPA: hypothetical protein ENI13_01225 [candidate division CPR3 bacterium]|uniref:Uncharacterized protein n=1 Tax=candidate division CPR3 bacterium TaxID=2268181 RepID=A0A7C1SXC1_UNCC3|nr:hypothetical protein [candidate division CPR3 bacterium]